jgi:hypothetical protein
LRIFGSDSSSFAFQITVPDEEMREQMERLSEDYDQTENADEILAIHDAHQELLAVLDGSEDAEAGGSPGPGWIPGDDADCRREVLDLLLHEAPGCSNRAGALFVCASA